MAFVIVSDAASVRTGSVIEVGEETEDVSNGTEDFRQQTLLTQILLQETVVAVVDVAETGVPSVISTETTDDLLTQSLTVAGTGVLDQGLIEDTFK